MGWTRWIVTRHGGKVWAGGRPGAGHGEASPPYGRQALSPFKFGLLAVYHAPSRIPTAFSQWTL